MKKMERESELFGESWVDDKGNRWMIDTFTEDEAEALSKTLYKCTGCIDCSHCRNCHDCVRCNQCSMCLYCRDCDHCITCSGCELCVTCLSCMDCYSCNLCEHCHTCVECDSCGLCQGCKGFKENPKRYVALYSKPYVGCMTAYWVTGPDMYVYAYGGKTWDKFEEGVKNSTDNDIVDEDMRRFYFNVRGNVRAVMGL